MIVKYKVSDFAKDLNLSAKKVLDELNAMGSTGKKNSSNLEENELNYLLEKFSKDNSVANLDEFLNSAKAAKEEPKPTEKKAEKKPEAPKAEKKPKQPAAKKAEPAQQDKNGNKHNEKKNEQHKKREEKTVSLSELARETGAKASAAPAQAVSVRREDNQVTVDTRTVDMNVDRFDARYDDLASTKNTENRLVLECVLKFHCVLLAIIVDQFNPIVVQHISILINAPRKTDSAELFVAFFQELNHSIHDKSHDINRFPHAVSNRPSIGGISDQNACNVIIICVRIEIFACFC